MSFIEEILVFVVAGFISTAVCITGYGIAPLDAFLGCGCIVAITVGGILLAKILPGHLPMVFWVSILAILVSTPISPVAGFVTYYVDKVDFLALCTVVLSYAGLTVGKDIDMFRKMSWRIIVVALAIYTGTFVFATIIAQIMLHLEGVI
jgi:hypothetical protein